MRPRVGQGARPRRADRAPDRGRERRELGIGIHGVAAPRVGVHQARIDALGERPGEVGRRRHATRGLDVKADLPDGRRHGGHREEAQQRPARRARRQAQPDPGGGDPDQSERRAAHQDGGAAEHSRGQAGGRTGMLDQPPQREQQPEHQDGERRLADRERGGGDQQRAARREQSREPGERPREEPDSEEQREQGDRCARHDLDGQRGGGAGDQVAAPVERREQQRVARWPAHVRDEWRLDRVGVCAAVGDAPCQHGVVPAVGSDRLPGRDAVQEGEAKAQRDGEERRDRHAAAPPLGDQGKTCRNGLTSTRLNTPSVT
jgi:hypothetical protein